MIEKHPSYGLIGITRTYGGDNVLFGSSIKHNNTITLRISRAEYHRDLHHDSFYERDGIIEVSMSNSQFAELITSANIGGGVPCTIRRMGKELVEPCPFKDKREQFTEELNNDLNKINKTSNEIISQVTQLFEEKKTLNKADKEAILSKLYTLNTQLNANSKFVYEMFQEQMDKTVKEAKGEVEAFVMNKINSMASEALRKEIESGAPSLIEYNPEN